MESPERRSPDVSTTTDHQGGRIVKRAVTFILGVLLLTSGISTAADGKTFTESPGGAASGELRKKLDLNRATREELVAVPGIGPRMAQEIVDLRAKKGSFARIEDLLEVTGIKEKKLAAIAEYLEIAPPQSSAVTMPAEAR